MSCRPPLPFRLPIALLTAATALALAACGGASESVPTTGPGSTEAAATTFPVTIEHAFGETTVPSRPTRVATVAWANHEVPLALGIVPVGMAEASWGDDDGDGVLPWVEDRLAALGADTPALFDETEGIDFEAVADTAPDLILASYSGLTEEEYQTLSKIAPTLAYPEVPWGTSMADMIRLSSTALGLADQGEELVTGLDADIEAAFAAHPELEGLTAMFSYIDPNDLSQVGFYTTHDPRSAFLEQLGMAAPAVVQDASADSEEFYSSVSSENADRFDDVDLMVTYGDPDGAGLAALQADPLLSRIPAIADGAVAVLPDATPLAAAANPSPLSIAWGLEQYVDLIAAAAAKVG